MILPATDHEHLRKTRSVCWSAAEAFAPEPEWGRWLRATHRIIGVYHESTARRAWCTDVIARRLDLPTHVATALADMSFVHHFRAGTTLRESGDRVTCAFVALSGTLAFEHRPSRNGHAPDGVAFSGMSIRCTTDAVVLCVPNASLSRVERRFSGSFWMNGTEPDEAS